MFGLLVCCAAAGTVVTVTAMSDTSELSQMPLFTLIVGLLR